MFPYPEVFEDMIEINLCTGAWRDAFDRKDEIFMKIHCEYRDKFNRYCMAEQIEAEFRGLT